MNEIDLGIINEKQVVEILKEMKKKPYNIYMTIAKFKHPEGNDNLSAAFQFDNKDDKNEFDQGSEKLVERLRKAGK